jgi:hypothetical protein
VVSTSEAMASEAGNRFVGGRHEGSGTAGDRVTEGVLGRERPGIGRAGGESIWESSMVNDGGGATGLGNRSRTDRLSIQGQGGLVSRTLWPESPT